MKVVLQRAREAHVTVSGQVIGSIGKGYVILLGVAEGDSEKEVDILCDKVVKLRIFADENGKMNKSLLDIHGEVLVVSQFTLLADTTGGRRPSFIHAAKPDVAQKLYTYCIQKLKDLGVKKVATGSFGAYMLVELVNDGPVTIVLDTDTF